MTGGIRLFIFGLGYTATAIGRDLRSRAEWVGGTVRTVEKAARLGAEGLATFVFDGSRPAQGLAAALAASTHLLASIAPGADGDPALRHHREDILAARQLAWIGYLSTVGVYGDRDGGWVDEETPVAPTRRRSVDRLAAEQAWLGLGADKGVPVGVFRLAGIYGPGRNPLLNLAEGTARRIIKPGQVFNRIHLADIIAVVEAAIARPATQIYNVTDDEPAPPQDVVAYAASLMSSPIPPDTPFARAELSPMARSFYGENKRVANRRIRDELGVMLAYPTYREGLTSLWKSGTWRGETVEPAA